MSFLRTATHRLSFALVLHFVGRSAMILSDGLCAASVNTGAVQMSVDSISIASCSSAWVHALTDLAASFSTLGNLFVLYTVLRIVNPAVQSSTPVVNLPKLVVEQNTAAPEWTVSRSARSSVVDMPNTVSQDVLFPVPRQPERSLADSAVPPRSPRMTTGHVVPTSPRSHIDRPIPNPSAAYVLSVCCWAVYDFSWIDRVHYFAASRLAMSILNRPRRHWPRVPLVYRLSPRPHPCSHMH
jgi:hypothetical protein